MIEEDARSKRRKAYEHALQRAFGYLSRGYRLWHLRQAYPGNRSADQRRKIVRNIGSVDDDLDRTTMVVECPWRDCAS